MGIRKYIFLGSLAVGLSAMAQQGPQEPASSSAFSSSGKVQLSSAPKSLNDLERLFSLEQQNQLEEMLNDFEEATGNQIVLISVDTMEDFYDFDQYSLHMIDKMEVERKIKGSGIVLVFSSKLRKIHLNTEFEIEKKLSDATYERVVKEVIIPEFKAGNHYAGIQQGVERLKLAYEN